MVAFGALFLLFWDSVWLWPLKILVVLFHELGHAMAAWLTGGVVYEIGLSPYQGGHTLSGGGIRLITLNAGYFGSLMAGVALLWASAKPKTAVRATRALTVLVLLIAVFYVRPLLQFAQLFTVVVGLALGLLSRYGSADVTATVLRFLGVFSVMYALWDIRDDVFLGSPNSISDAAMLAQHTGIPAPIWGSLWVAAGLTVLWLTRRWIV